ncbi:bifunctional hydroxymethylpyrimidine kinase/phosphomethylpyrimidine kinase [Bifidobacterium sp. ESL0732]|uniref:bifunctional hydroxymethylpyrimidine kinase/phosphomethylpyrimidine kinase n=1 Tax=Bifidobacterium sp. ESL0732 TaxID=2983222 RepID=UPI0023F7313F|nr:bifunctional hydroxymethylpyrimidine kinase/phosphomethylpyrimidine kinase [Bifidobacterium sp. ESL0732]WEV63661.1 bifunctional hydroxymethylpyrimidine kinase/phosphomethylpyrimidine kinase [Bifidobacterium sp. ESL0732]
MERRTRKTWLMMSQDASLSGEHETKAENHLSNDTGINETSETHTNPAKCNSTDTVGVHPYKLPAVLSIAGSDSSGGAGIQADLKTFMACGVYGMSAITSLTAQNTTGVRASAAPSPDMLAAQIAAVFEDIRPDAVKIGMVPNAELIGVIADRLKYYNAVNVVVDPVMIASSGDRLSSKASIDTLCTKLLPLATLVTPNIPEAETIANLGTRPVRDRDTTSAHNLAISDEASTINAARTIVERCGGCAVLIKGGHRQGAANDLLFENGETTWFRHTRINNPNTHGTGCTLSSAIAAGLAKHESLTEAVQNAKDYLTGCIAAGLDLGAGSGPMDHAWKWRDSQN